MGSNLYHNTDCKAMTQMSVAVLGLTISLYNIIMVFIPRYKVARGWNSCHVENTSFCKELQRVRNPPIHKWNIHSQNHAVLRPSSKVNNVHRTFSKYHALNKDNRALASSGKSRKAKSTKNAPLPPAPHFCLCFRCWRPAQLTLR